MVYNISTVEQVKHVLNNIRNIIETEARNKGRLLYPSDNTRAATPFFDPSKNTALLEPEKDADGYWVGAPSPFKDPDTGELFLYYRTRDADRRGRTGTIARLDENNEMETVWEIDKKEISAHSVEGAAIDKKDGKYYLYLSYHDLHSNQWKIDILEAESLEQLDYSKARPLEIDTGKFFHVKDPVIYGDNLIVDTYTKHWFSEANYLVTDPLESADAERIKFNGKEGRITSVISTGEDDFFLYDWKRGLVFTGEARTKVAKKVGDLEVEEITDPDEAIASEHGTGALRYVKPVKVDDEYTFFYEKSMPNNGHELCIITAPTDAVENSELLNQRV